MRLLPLVLLVVAAMKASAFTTKKREPTRRAFQQAALANSGNAAAAVEQQEATVREDQPVFAFAGQAMVPVQVVDYDDADDVVIGYGTGLLACMASLALGFALGYGTP